MHLIKKYDLIETINLNHTFFCMKKSFTQIYYDFFDKEIEDSTIVVWLIGTMIFLTWFLSNTQANYKSNIMEYRNNYQNVVLIDWKKYKMVFEEIR